MGSSDATFFAGGLAAAGSTLLLCFGLAFTPFFEWTWLLVIVPCALVVLFVVVQLLHGLEWERACKTRGLTISSFAMGGGTLLAHAAIYGLWWRRDFLPASIDQPLRSCIHHYAAITSLFNCAVLSIRWSTPWVFVVQVFLQPMATIDRVPLAGLFGAYFYDHFACIYGILTSLCVLGGPALVVTVSPTRASASGAPAAALQQLGAASELLFGEAKCGEAKYGEFRTTVERLQQLCAGLSLGYLLVCWRWLCAGHTPLLDVAYHIAWSFLRPCYVMLFLVYWIKRLPLLKGAQALLCGLGFGYFLALSALAETDMTARAGTRLSTMPGHLTNLGKAGHRVEACGFYTSMLLFFVHGICSGQWAEIGMRFQVLMLSLGLVQFCLVILCELNQIHSIEWWNPLEKSSFLFGFVMVHYGIYATICFASTYILHRGGDAPSTHELVLSLTWPGRDRKRATYRTVDF